MTQTEMMNMIIFVTGTDLFVLQGIEQRGGQGWAMTSNPSLSRWKLKTGTLGLEGSKGAPHPVLEGLQGQVEEARQGQGDRGAWDPCGPVA